MSKLLLVICSGLGLWEFADGSAFLGSPPHAGPESVSEAEIQASLLEEIHTALGPDTAGGRVTEMEEALRPMYIALPKNEYGNVGHAIVRYALHRLFVRRHGWFITGLEKRGEHRNTTSAAGILKDRAPGYIQDLFEERMGGHGLSLHEVAVLASTIEHLVHGETKSRLEASFNAHGMPLGSPVSNDQAIDVIETYMMAWLTSHNLTSTTSKHISLLRARITQVFPLWPSTQKWVHEVHQETVGDNSSAMLDFEGVLRTANKLGEGYGRHQGAECDQTLADMLNFEDGSSGRVLISTFYKAALDGMWQFSESVDYLRELGALDESSGQPSVIVPNYMGGLSNCVASSDYFKVCCPDKCEGLFAQIEGKIASSHAKPKPILDLVRALPSSTTSAPRDLPSGLIERLDEIAASNEGYVPIHGRLFAQWMHHAYPRECPYPHVSGTTNPRTTREYRAATGVRATLTKSQKEEYVAAMETKPVEVGDSTAVEVPWTDEEELLIIRPAAPPSSNNWSVARNIVLAMTLSSFVYALVLPAMAAVHTVQGRRSEKMEKMFV